MADITQVKEIIDAWFNIAKDKIYVVYETIKEIRFLEIFIKKKE